MDLARIRAHLYLLTLSVAVRSRDPVHQLQNLEAVVAGASLAAADMAALDALDTDPPLMHRVSPTLTTIP